MIEKTYQPADIEGRMSRLWEEAGAFKAGREERRDAKPFTIVIPPPNVTGSLHMGHALNNTLQDILCRFERMRGRDVLWQPGTDHAGIATQMVVERQLMERQQPGRREMGRAKFLERVWQWKAESGGVIVNQLKRLGASCDWSRERFTMDEGLSRAVIKVFVALHREGLIYKDKRLVNWDPALLTAISDLEVQQIEVKGHLWYLRYPLQGKTFNPEDPSTFIVVATTRPETMLGDTAVAVHPDDERYTDLVGKHVILPLVGRKIPIVADEYSDPEKGSGAVKITPAHDFNDFEVGKRHGLPQISVLSPEAKLFLNGNSAFLTTADRGRKLFRLMPEVQSPESVAAHNQALNFELLMDLDGLSTSEARKKIVASLEAKGFVEKIEPHGHMVPHGDRSGVVIEPYLTEQWYVNAKALAEPALAAVRDGKTNFVPKNWEKTYFDWMDNIQPWCISRQLWWGHQIPAWYGRDRSGDSIQAMLDTAEIFVAMSEADAVRLAQDKYGCEIRVLPSRPSGDKLSAIVEEMDADRRAGKPPWEPIWRDEDVLDTWFSSALWPFSTLGWPDDTPEVKRYYPTNVLVTGFDIIFFWVARMMMMGLHFRKEVPFRDVYIHRLVRDEKGAKMSKSKGNVIDPLGVIDEYGADALRFALARAAAQGHDIKLSSQLVETNRNFATKLWNACRFAEMNGCATRTDFNPASAEETINRWIAHQTSAAASDVTAALTSYRFNDAANLAYRFVWNIYCDWYLEFAKPLLLGPDSDAKAETQAMVAWARDEILKLLHPFMPFITEELWAVTGHEGLLALAEWPWGPGTWHPQAATEIGWVIDVVTAIRSARAEMNVNVPLPLVLARTSDQIWARSQRWSEFLKRTARISGITRLPAYPPGTMQLVVGDETIGLTIAGLIDLSAERTRLDKELAKAEADIKRVDTKLANEKFVANAPEEIVEEEKEKREAAAARKAKILEALERLKNAA
jgi:valyl-tRNA synthetase